MISTTEIEDLGFEHVKSYPHDDFYTKRFKKGIIQVEFTYRDDKLYSVDVTIDEVVGMEMSFEQLRTIDEILNKQ